MTEIIAINPTSVKVKQVSDNGNVTNTQLNAALADKVNVEAGKGLISTAEIIRLATLSDYGWAFVDPTITNSIQTAFTAGAKKIRCIAGQTYNITSTIYIPDGCDLDVNGAIINCSSAITGPAVSTYELPFKQFKRGQSFKNATITGNCTYALVIMGTISSSFDKIVIKTTSTHGVLIDGSFGLNIGSMSTEGSTITGADYFVGADFNASTVSNLYTSGFSQSSFRSDENLCALTGYRQQSVDGTGTLKTYPTGAGSTINTITCQGSKVGLDLRSVNGGGITFNAVYYENCSLPVQMGALAAQTGSIDRLCQGVVINSLNLLNVWDGKGADHVTQNYQNDGSASLPTVRVVDFVNAENCIIQNITMPVDSTIAICRYGKSKNNKIGGLPQFTSGTVAAKVTRSAAAAADDGVTIDYSEMGTNVICTKRIVKSDAYGYQHEVIKFNNGASSSVFTPALV